MKKNRGNVLIESMLSIIITITLINVGVKAYIQSANEFNRLLISENLKMAVYNIKNEIKYNFSYEDVEVLFKGENQIGLKYDSKINEKLMKRNLKNMEEGRDIKIICKDNSYEEILIKAEIPFESKDIVMEERIIKKWWMNEI